MHSCIGPRLHLIVVETLLLELLTTVTMNTIYDTHPSNLTLDSGQLWVDCNTLAQERRTRIICPLILNKPRRLLFVEGRSNLNDYRLRS